MNDHKKFLQLLAKEINGGAEKFSFEKLKTHFLEAVSALPNGTLKDILQEQNQENSEHLWNLVKPARKCSEVDFTIQLVRSQPIQFNIFNKDGLEEMLRKISQLHSHKEQIQYLSQLALCYPCNKVFELLLTAQKMESPDQSLLQVLNKVTELYGRLTVGCHNFEVLHGLMEVFLSEIDKINEKLKASNGSQESWLDFKDVIHRFLVHCHVKRKVREQDTLKGDDGVTLTQRTKYRDALAAVMAIYIDVIIAIGQISEDVSNHLSNLVYLLLGDSPSHILDAANQIFTLDSITVNIVLPLLRKIFHSTKTCTAKCENYIKYLYLARKVENCVQNLEVEALYLKKNVCSLLPPENFSTWLSNVDSSIIEDLELSGLDGHKITDKILLCEDEEKIEKLLDLTTSSGKLNEMTEKDPEQEQNTMNEDESNVPLFFVDAEGSSELVEQCQEKEFTNSTNDKILKNQIRILLEKLEETGPEDEKGDFDIELDEDENVTTLDFGDNNVSNGVESKNGDGEISDSRRGDGKEEAVEDANEINMATSQKQDENLTPTEKTRKKRKSPGSSVVPKEERRVKSSKRKLSKKRRS